MALGSPVSDSRPTAVWCWPGRAFPRPIAVSVRPLWLGRRAAPPGTLVLGRGPEGAGATLCWPAVQANLGGRIPAAANAEKRVLQTFPDSSRGPGGLSEMPTVTKPVQATQLPRGEGQRGTHPGTTQQRHERHTRAATSEPKYGARPPPQKGPRGDNAQQPSHRRVPQQGRGTAPLPRGGPPVPCPT